MAARRVTPGGTLTLEKRPALDPTDLGRSVVEHGWHHDHLSDEVNEWRQGNRLHLMRRANTVIDSLRCGFPTLFGALWLQKHTAEGEIIDFGLASLAVVTTAGAGFIIDAFQNLVELETMKYHGIGTGTNAENVADTALQTELTTQYATNSTRPTGSQGENGATVYRTSATITPDSGLPLAITEHGLFSQAGVPGGVLLDRSVFSAINLTTLGDSVAAQYDFTVTAGS